MADWNSSEYTGEMATRIATITTVSDIEAVVSYAGKEIQVTLAEDGIFTDQVTGLKSRSLGMLASTILDVNKIRNPLTGEEIHCPQHGYSLWEIDTSGWRPSKLPHFSFGDRPSPEVIRKTAQKLIAAMPEGCSPEQWMWENYGPAGRHTGLLAEIAYQVRYGHTQPVVCIPVGLPGPTPEQTILAWCLQDKLVRSTTSQKDVVALLTRGNGVIADRMCLSGGITKWAKIARAAGARIEIIDLMSKTMTVEAVYNHLADIGECESRIPMRRIQDAANSTYARLAPQNAKEAVRTVRKYISEQRAAVKAAISELPR